MDPNAALDRITTLLADLNAPTGRGPEVYAADYERAQWLGGELDETCRDLFDWLARGGFRPTTDTAARQIAWGYFAERVGMIPGPNPAVHVPCDCEPAWSCLPAAASAPDPRRQVVVARTVANACEAGRIAAGMGSITDDAELAYAVSEFWGLDLTLSQIRAGDVDGMNVWQWLDAMTMD